jgi:hypothetical protein
VLPLLVLAALVVAWMVRYAVAKRARARFSPPEGSVTLAIRLKPSPRPIGWRHGFARLDDDRAAWRAEHSLKAAADLTFERGDLVVRDHRPVVKADAMLNDLCELVDALYKGEAVQFGVPKAELDRFLEWAR